MRRVRISNILVPVMSRLIAVKICFLVLEDACKFRLHAPEEILNHTEGCSS